MAEKFYGVFAKAPSDRKKLHTWALKKSQADSFAHTFRSKTARNAGWRSVQVKPLSDTTVRRLCKQAKRWTPSTLPPTMKRLIRKGC